jgi:hypothetical protein
MSFDKKNIRKQFRDSVFARDNNKCKICGAAGKLDAHHIFPRTVMFNGGYVKENGISLCEVCHLKAEQFYSIGVAALGFSPDELFKMIGSNHEPACLEAKK